MDIYKYVNSTAIRKYLKYISYDFTAEEAAWLIYQSDSASLKEKKNAWMQLIEEIPDCPMGNKYNRRDSVHDFIREYIAALDKQYEEFKKIEEGTVYQYRFYCKNDCAWCEDFAGVYASFDECMKEIDEDRDLGIEVYDIRKRYISSNRMIDVRYRADDTVMDIYPDHSGNEESDTIGEGFEGLWFDFPVPFEKGDILIRRPFPGPQYLVSESGPFIMEGITPWEKERNKRRKEQGFGDNSDMNAWGYFQDEDGRIFHEVMFNYMDLEYYEGPFTRERRFLVALSNFVKGKIELELLLSAYRKIILDEMADDVMLHSWYTNEGLLLAGLDDVVAGNNRRVIESGLNPNKEFDFNGYRRENYDWSKNQELYDKCRKIASNYGQPKEMLYIYGPHGCGKTTILQCLGNLAMRLCRPDLLYVTAENFVNELISVIRSSDKVQMDEFREKYRKLNYLIVDDIQTLCDKETSTEEFTNILNDLITADAQVIVSADRPLDELDLSERLKSKLSFATQMEMKRWKQ